MYELWTGTPNEVKRLVASQAPGEIRRKAKTTLAEMQEVARKFEPETVKAITSVMEEINGLIVSDTRVGEPFRRVIPYMNISYVIEIRRT